MAQSLDRDAIVLSINCIQPIVSSALPVTSHNESILQEHEVSNGHVTAKVQLSKPATRNSKYKVMQHVLVPGKVYPRALRRRTRGVSTAPKALVLSLMSVGDGFLDTGILWLTSVMGALIVLGALKSDDIYPLLSVLGAIHYTGQSNDEALRILLQIIVVAFLSVGIMSSSLFLGIPKLHLRREYFIQKYYEGRPLHWGVKGRGPRTSASQRSSRHSSHGDESRLTPRFPAAGCLQANTSRGATPLLWE